MNKQRIFGWFEEMLGQRTVVKSLLRFRPGVAFRRSYRDGRLNAVSYQAWLRWYTPLCERGY